MFANFFSEHLDLDLMATSSTKPIKFKVQVKCTCPATLSSDPPHPTSSTSDSNPSEYVEEEVGSEMPVECEIETADDSEFEEIEVED